MKMKWKKTVSIGGDNAKFVNVDGQIGHIEFNNKEEAEAALHEFGCYHDAFYENWQLIKV